MKKKKNDEERKPDIVAGENQEELEKRVHEMLEPDRPAKRSVSKKTTKQTDEEEASSAPILPSQRKSIKIIHHTDLEDKSDQDDKSKDEAETEPNEEETVATPPEKVTVEVMSDEDEEAEDIDTESEAVSEEEADTDEDEELTEASDDLTADEPVETEETEESEEQAEESPEEPDDNLDETIKELNKQLLNETKGVTEEEEAPEETEATTEDEQPEDDTEPEVEHTKTEEIIKDPKTEKAVEDIVEKESDELLAAEDEKLAAAFQPAQKRSLRSKLGNFFRKKSVRIGLLALLFVGLAGAATVPASRYFVLNNVGVRSSASLRVIDKSSQQPLKNVKVSLAGVESVTNQDGIVKLDHLRLGSSELKIHRRAFAPVISKITIGWGSNPLGDYELVPTGSQYTFVLTDYLSGNPVAEAEAESDEFSAVADEKGKIILTIDESYEQTAEVVITAEGYRKESFTINLDDQSERQLKMVAGRKHVFVSKRSGTFDLYKIDIDGKNEALVLPGTGSEREDITINPHPTEEYVAFVSTRDNRRNEDGFLLSALTVIDLSDNSNKVISRSERVQVIGWIENKLIYVQVVDGASAVNPKRHRLMSYDVSNEAVVELAASNHFNDVTVADNKVIYAPAAAYTPKEEVGLFRVNADGSDRRTIMKKEVWNMFRLSYDKLTLALQQEWYEYRLDDSSAPGKINKPGSLVSKTYAMNPRGNKGLWVDNRDGKGVLLAYDIESKEDQVIRTDSGLKSPVRWLNNTTVVYRVLTGEETADYAMSTDGGDPVKIVDVTDTNSVENWYYY